MGGGRTSMDTVRRRTRNQWDEYYKNQYTQTKRKNDGESSRTNSTNVAVALEKKSKLDTRENVDSDDSSESNDDDRFLDKHVVPNGSALRTGPNSVRGSGSEVDNVAKKGAETRGRPRDKSVDKKQVDSGSESSYDSVDSSEFEFESESTSEEDKEFSDEDYKAGGSDDSEQEEDEDSNHSDKGYNHPINEKEIYRAKKKKERDDYDDEGYHKTNDGGDHNKDEDVVITVDEEKFQTVKKNAEKKHKGEGKLDGNLRKKNVSKLDVDLDKAEMDLEKFIRSNKIFESKEKEPKLGKCNSPIESASSSDNEYKSSRAYGSFPFDRNARGGSGCSVKQMKLGNKKPSLARKLDLIKILVDSINAHKGQQFNLEKNALPQNALPSRFRFEDEVAPPKEKSEWEKEIDSLFRDLELGLRESEIDSTNFYEMEKDPPESTEIEETPAARCGRGEHTPLLDDETGIVCKYCHTVILEIKYVFASFYAPPSVRGGRRDCDGQPSSFSGKIKFPDSGGKNTNSVKRIRGTVWDLIPDVEMFPHQSEGFEFIWKNIAGDIVIENLKETLPNGRGCIISHAPGTGKTRLTIVFLQTFLKLYPTCCPVIIAPRGMLLTWESEFVKWGFDFPFHNLNKQELSGNENAVASQIFGRVGGGVFSTEVVRLLKLYSWTKGGGVLGISYTLFEKLAGENGKEGLHGNIREVLLERPGLLVLDEGHTPRNDRSRLWRALSKVGTERRIILSGTPFQNNLKELYNTLCLVNPRFVNQIGLGNDTSCKSVARKRWAALTNSIGKNKDDGLKKLRLMLDPFVHVHEGSILQKNLPGMRHTLVFLHPTKYQKTLLETSSKVTNIFQRIRLVSLVSVHPSLNPVRKKQHSIDKSKLEEIESDVDAGVKMKFLMKLIWLADSQGERVLVFSQFIDPLLFIKKQLETHLSWFEGREVLYMDGQLEEKQRQDSIVSFNDDTSEAKVLLASERACSEGINLVGASRVVLLDTVWNPSVEKQAISRAYRLGQKKVVHVYRLFTSGIEVRQFAQQIKKVRLSELIFSPGSGHTSKSENSHRVSSEDKLLDAMLNLERFNGIFEKIICQPKESELLEIFGLEKQK